MLSIEKLAEVERLNKNWKKKWEATLLICGKMPMPPMAPPHFSTPPDKPPEPTKPRIPENLLVKTCRYMLMGLIILPLIAVIFLSEMLGDLYDKLLK